MLGFPGEESLVLNFFPHKGLFSVTDVRRIPSQGVALGASIAESESAVIGPGAELVVAAKARNIMEVQRMFAHSSEGIMRNTTEAMGIATTGQWGSCEASLQVKAKRRAVPKMTDERASVKGRRLFEDVGGLMRHSSVDGNNYVVIFVYDYTCFNVVTFVKKKSDTTAVLLPLSTDNITPQELSIKCIRTDNGGIFEGELQR